MLDPTMSRSFAGRIVFASLCDKLFDIDEKLAIVPQLATSYQWSPDNKVLTLKLRPGGTFHDGEKFDAAAVKFNIEGPVLLMYGLTHIPASYASLLLNMEGVLTSLLAWFVFKENFDRGIFIGMMLIVGGGVALAWEERPPAGVPWGAVAIVCACLCWGIDNNLTRKVSASDAVQIASIKALVAGVVNLSIARALGISTPPASTILVAGVVGFCGYGLSLVLFVLALRNLGTARTGAYFSAAPFVGAVVSLALLGEIPGAGFWIGGALMTTGILLHLTETHCIRMRMHGWNTGMDIVTTTITSTNTISPGKARNRTRICTNTGR
jgi:drug/metabolite transporter (DMT)-like permease